MYSFLKKESNMKIWEIRLINHFSAPRATYQATKCINLKLKKTFLSPTYYISPFKHTFFMSCNNICTCIFFSSVLINAKASKLLTTADGKNRIASEIQSQNVQLHWTSSALWQVKWNFLMHIYEAHIHRHIAHAH